MLSTSLLLVLYSLKCLNECVFNLKKCHIWQYLCRANMIWVNVDKYYWFWLLHKITHSGFQFHSIPYVQFQFHIKFINSYSKYIDSIFTYFFFYLLVFTMSRYSRYLVWNTYSRVVYLPCTIVMEEISLNKKKMVN